MTTGTLSAHPPIRQSAFLGLDPCVHCGFCLPACPTYEVTGDEADSPRGRIVMMRALARGEMTAADAAVQEHLDRCLGCRGCESVCPSGVIFGPALEASRAMIEAVRPLPVVMRIALWVLARPSRQKVLWFFARLLRATGLPRAIARGAGLDAPVWVRMLAMLAATGRRGDGETGRTARSSSVPPSPRPPVSLFRGCVQDGLFGHVHDATIDALTARQVSVAEVGGQVCCGALAAHAGDEKLARALAAENVRAFAGSEEPIVVNSAGCGAMLKAYGHWTEGGAAFAARVRDVSEMIDRSGDQRSEIRSPDLRSSDLVKVAYDAPCHLIHAQRVTKQPLDMLAGSPGIELVHLEGSDRCCGSAGLYAMIEPGMSRAVLERKLAAIRDANPDVVATGNPGCLMQIGAGLLLEESPVRVCHPVELMGHPQGVPRHRTIPQ